jgi:hypothetical protein
MINRNWFPLYSQDRCPCGCFHPACRDSLFKRWDSRFSRGTHVAESISYIEPDKAIVVLKQTFCKRPDRWLRRSAHCTKRIRHRSPHVIHRTVQDMNQCRNRGHRFRAQRLQRNRRQSAHSRIRVA